MRFSVKSVKTKILLPTAVVIALGILFTIFLTAKQVEKAASAEATEKAKGDLALTTALIDARYPGEWSVRDGKLYKGDVVMNENWAVVDEINRLTGDSCTIFLGDTRIATTVKKEGKRAVGTQAAPEVVETVLKKGQGFYGEAEVVGVKYQTAYEPIKDADGRIIGMLYVGANKQFVDNVIRDTTTSIALTSGLALLAIIAVLFFLTNYAVSPVKHLISGANRIAEGDFTQEIRVKSQDELGRLAETLNRMREQLRELVKSIAGTAESLAAQSQELAAATEQVSATVEEVSSTAEEVSSVSEQSAENALTAADKAEQVRTAARSGSGDVNNTITKINQIASVTQEVNAAVQKLGTISKQIGDIINVITGIADQTNLLALNAAIEAARAGEQGRGFAVVAEEVRKLAEQSANAAKEIAGLIAEIQRGVGQAVTAMEKSVTEVREGVQTADATGKSLQQIISAVEEAANLIRDIAEGAKQTNEGMQQLSGATEQITSAVQEVAASAGDLSKNAEKLSGAIARFRV
ncbi:MAG: methyl-accepting chemotaxis protein [Bacillota bacterium]